jgi:hypothetical protein
LGHSRFAISIARHADYWTYLFAKGPVDEFFWIGSDRRETIGFVRLSEHDGVLKVRDYSLLQPEDSSFELLLRAVLSLALKRGIAKVSGWLPECAFAQSRGVLKLRDREITMLKSLRPELAVDPAVLRDSQHFHEIDHV